MALFEKWFGLRPASRLVALNAQIPQTHGLFVLLGEAKARAFLEHTTNRLAHRAAAAGGLIARSDSVSLLALFQTGEQALRAACVLREELRQWCLSVDAHFELKLDIGISRGAVLCRPPVYEGETIQRASSLATAASAGQILVDEAVLDGLPEELIAQLEPARPDDDGPPAGIGRTWIYLCPGEVVAPAAPLWVHLRSPDGRLHLTFAPERPIRIGRDARADIVLSTPGISRQHAVITWRNGHYTLTDTSRNGTWVQHEHKSGPKLLQHNVCQLHDAGWLHLGREPSQGRTPDLLYSISVPPAPGGVGPGGGSSMPIPDAAGLV